MREIIVGVNDAGQRLDHFLMKAVPALPASLRQKFLRTKHIKLNGKKTEAGARLSEGDVIRFFIHDDFFVKPDPDCAFRSLKPDLSIVYEDDNILLANKPVGMVVHEDDHDTINTLINHIKAYLYSNGAWDPGSEQSFVPALCNRIDRNTQGIVIAAKNAATLRIINQKIKDRELHKYYLCIVHGKMTPRNGTLKNFLSRDLDEKRVYVYDSPRKDTKTAVTHYKTLSVQNDLSLIECELITGRTHQIRAQFAHAGHPLLGDGKYGTNELNRRYHEKYQTLCSYKIQFDFTTDAEHLSYLDKQIFAITDVEFAKKFSRSSF